MNTGNPFFPNLYPCFLQKNQPAKVRSRGTKGIMAGPRVRVREGENPMDTGA